MTIGMSVLGGAMRTASMLLVLLLTLSLLSGAIPCSGKGNTRPASPSRGTEAGVMRIPLPRPSYEGAVSLEQSLVKRRSVREYSGEPLDLKAVSQLLWAAQGITGNWGGRTAPSAGALYPLQLYVITGSVEDLTPGIYRYDPEPHELVIMARGDMRARLSRAALEQSSVRNGAVDLVFTAIYRRTTGKYGKRGIRYVHMEIGHAAQNVCLQATAMGLGAVTVGAFQDEEVSTLLHLPEHEVPLYIIPVGKR